jgi:hypothetical protein
MYDNCYYCAEDKPHPDLEEENFQRIRQNAAFSQERWRAQGILTRANSEIDANNSIGTRVAIWTWLVP